jgi:hypothetical protein
LRGVLRLEPGEKLPAARERTTLRIAADRLEEAIDPRAEKPAAGEQKVEGQVRSIDPSKKEMTLADGAKFTIPAETKLPPEVKRGATVTSSYKEEAGKKVLTAVEVQPAASPRTTPPVGAPKR